MKVWRCWPPCWLRLLAAGGGRMRSRTETSPWNGRQKQLCVSLDKDTLAEIDRAADAAGQTRSQWVRERLEWALMEDADA